MADSGLGTVLATTEAALHGSLLLHRIDQNFHSGVAATLAFIFNVLRSLATRVTPVTLNFAGICPPLPYDQNSTSERIPAGTGDPEYLCGIRGREPAHLE